ncbi:MAG: flagellin [Rhodobacterales bacterium]|nr:flagellin [Rhodobacterales bacterium]
MTMLTIGDMAQTYMLQRQNVQLKQQMNQLTQELASGRTANVADHLSGNYSYLSDIEHGLEVLDGFDTATSEATLFTDTMQNTLGRVQDVVSDLAGSLIATTNTNLVSVYDTVSADARSQMASLVTSLNTSVAGRALFSGVAVDSSALVSSEDMLSSLRTAVAGEVTLSGIKTAVDVWFDAPGGSFETLAYTGATQSMSPIQLGEGESVDLDIRADDQVFRDMLKQTAIAALASDPTLGYSAAMKGDLLLGAGEKLLTSTNGIISIRADLGFTEARIDESVTRIAAEKTSLEYARGELLGVDPYDTATKLETVQFQLESLYAVTVRLSRLSLVDFLR